ncbi:hypothetical protein Gasu2_10940 [Galdieria sulphuraria]|nr:hypothetical protein Gasu2_10940 [Galdieria sulphuraria]
MAESNGFLSVFRNATRRTFSSSQGELNGTPTTEGSSLSSLAWATSNLLQPVTSTVRSQLWQIWCSAKPWSEFASSKKLKTPSDAADFFVHLIEAFHRYCCVTYCFLLKMIVLTVVAVFLIWITGAVYVITSWLGVAFVIAVAHAVMHLPADEPDFESTV